MTEVTNVIESLLPSLDGWCSQGKAHTLASIIVATRPDVALEVGTYAGRSAIPMALAMKYVGKGTLIGVDPYSPQESAKSENSVNSEWWLRLDHNAILEKFKLQITRLGLQNIIRIERMTSDQYVPQLGIGLLHIDGSHGEQAIRDAQRYCPCVKLGGFVVLDDIHWLADNRMAVAEAAEWMESNGFVKLFEVVKQSTDPNVPCDDWAVYCKLHVTRVEA